MSADIWFNEDMWYVGDKAWHGMGIQVDSLNTLPDGADREYSKLPVYAQMPDGSMRQIDTHAAIYTPTRDNIVSVMGSDYQIHGIREFYDGVFRPYMEAGELEGETLGFLGGGKRMWLLARVPGQQYDAGSGDVSRLYMLLATSFDGTLGSLSKGTDVRVVCQNTLSLAMRSGKKGFSQRHTSALKVDKAKEEVEAAVSAFRNQAAIAQFLKSTPATPTIARSFMTELIQPELIALTMPEPREKVPAIRQILNSDATLRTFEEAFFSKANRTVANLLEAVPTQKGGFDRTMYGLANAVSYWTDHTRGRSNDARTMSALFGQSDDLKVKAYQLANDYATTLAA